MKYLFYGDWFQHDSPMDDLTGLIAETPTHAIFKCGRLAYLITSRQGDQVQQHWFPGQFQAKAFMREEAPDLLELAKAVTFRHKALHPYGVDSSW